jgi:ribosomal protein S12 methylthiotransferase accessory factor YcaO
VVYLFARGAHQFCPGLSTGLVCGRPGEPVLLRGLQEVIERDALVGAWWGRYALTEWPASELWAALDAALVRRFQRPNLEYRFYRIETPFHPQVTICTVAGENRGGFCFAVGSACRTGLMESFTKSLLEAIQSLVYARSLKEEVQSGRRPAARVPRDFADHAVYYSLHPEALRNTPLQRPRHRSADAAAALSKACAAEKTEEDPAVALRQIIQRLGPERPVLFRSLTPPGIAQERPGPYVLRVLVPGLQPLHGDDHFPQLGGPLWAPRSAADFAALPPHPFP